MKRVIGIDIGIKSIKLVSLALKGKSIELLSQETLKAPKISNQNDIKDLLKVIFEKHRLKLSTPICISIAAEDSFFKIIPIKSSGTRKLKEAIQVELKKNVVFSLEDCIWDYSLLEYKPKETLNEVLLVAAKKEAVYDKMQLISQFSSGNNIINLDILATYNCLKFNTELLSGKLYALVDISSHKTQVLIFDGKENFWMRTIPFGGDKFTDIIADNLSLSVDEAQVQKKNMMLQEDMPEQLKEPSDIAMKQVVAELDKTFNYFYFQASESAAKDSDQKINEIFLSGGGSLYFGLDKFLSSTFNIPTRYIYPLNKISVKDKKALASKSNLTVQSPQSATAMGLALQGLNASEIKINLMESKQADPFKNLNLNNIYYPFVIVCVGLLVFLGTQMANISKDIRLLQPKSENLSKISSEFMPKLIELKEESGEIKSQLKTLSTVVNNRGLISRILYKMSEIISEETWATNFVIKLDYPTRSGELTIGGSSRSYAGINTMISGLKDMNYFKEIKPVSSKVMIDQVTKNEIVNFVIKCEVEETE
ncbi:pilus assembly protein PilM [Candidatus Omnitrophota bacterium]